MKAITIRKFGDFDVLKYQEIETPQPKITNHFLLLEWFRVLLFLQRELSYH